MKHFLMTIDTEAHKGKDPVKKLIYGELASGKLYGVDKLMDIFDSQGVKALFFVDIAEAWNYGEKAVSDLMMHIKNRGHDVGVHIHPDHMADRKRLFLWEYSREEQYEIIKKCTDFYCEVFGEKPKAFRAGKYGANKETLEILAELGYRADFSQFHGQKWCKIEQTGTKIRPVTLQSGLVEYPVSAYKSFEFGGYSRTDKLDMEMPFSEFKYIVTRIWNATDVGIMFAHSFSLLKWRANPASPKPNNHNCRKLSRMLDYLINKKKIRPVSLDELLEGQDEIDINDGCLPQAEGLPALIFFALRAFRVLKMRIDIKRQKK